MKRLFLTALVITACDARVSFRRSDIEAAPVGEGLPPGFLLGAATSSHQVEGNNTNDWTEWEKGSFEDGSPHIHDQSVSGAATDSYNRFDEDLALLKTLGANTYRFSVEWSRLEPKENQWREDVANRYLEWTLKLRQAGIEPMVTLHHFTLPTWVAEQGGWENEQTLFRFTSFVFKVATKLGAQVDLWCTVNEPNVYAVQGYIDGIWPPGKKDSRAAALVLARLIEAHAFATSALRVADTVDADGDGRAVLSGLAHHVRVFQPASNSTLDTTVAGLTDDFFNEAIVRAARTGRIQLSVPGEIEIDREVIDLKGSFDYLGLNYYTRDHVRADLGDPSLSKQYVPKGRPVNQLGWDIYPEGLYQFLRRFGQEGWPIYITENGIADAEGTERPYFLRAHLYAVERALAEGVDVRGYYHWSLLDNFEWAEGYVPRFGLYRVDFDSPEKARTPTEAVETFRDIAQRAGLSPQP
ncbi:MAG: glycoside hydrolase family 1 protein [Myxococcota bacterium]